MEEEVVAFCILVVDKRRTTSDVRHQVSDDTCFQLLSFTKATIETIDRNRLKRTLYYHMIGIERTVTRRG